MAQVGIISKQQFGDRPVLELCCFRQKITAVHMVITPGLMWDGMGCPMVIITMMGGFIATLVG
eukprot:4604660-Ditylum_brightwellii.AAC.1